MNSLQLNTGGRPVANDDFQVLQDRDAVLGLPALLTGLGPCVVSGCRVYQTGSQYNVGAGMVWDGANLLPFSGRSNVALPMMFAPGAVVVVDERAYQTGGTKTTIKEQSMDLVPVVAGAPNCVVDTWGALTFWHRTQEKTRTVGDVQFSANQPAANYDTDGLGLPGTQAWGWGLCNGMGGRADLRGQFVAGLDPNRADYDTIGKTGGEERHQLAVAEMPRHNHTVTTHHEGNDLDRIYGSIVGQANGANAGTAQGSVDYNGSGQAHENRPPFYVLGVVQWVGY